MSAFTTVLALVWSAFIVTTIRTLWKGTEGRYATVVYGFGVRQLGLLAWVTFSLLMALGFGEMNDGTSFVERLVFFGFLGFPVCLWTGYYAGWTIARVMGIEKNHDK